MARITIGTRLSNLANDANLEKRDRDFAASLLAYYNKKRCLTAGRRQWLDKLETKAAAEAVRAANTTPVAIPPRLLKLRATVAANEGPNSWNLGFLDSVIEQMKRRRALSAKQQTTLDKIEHRHGAWPSEYEADFADAARQVAAYYRRAKLPYFRKLVDGVLDNENYVPSKEGLVKMLGNRYAQRVLEQAALPPVYADHSVVVLRKTARTSPTCAGIWRAVGSKVGFVLSSGDIIDAVKGGRGYEVLFAGAVAPVTVQERYLKVKRS